MFLFDVTDYPGLVLAQILLAALVFYLLIPVSGAFFARHKWRVFRKNLRRALDIPMAVHSVTALNGNMGLHRFLGELEAIEGDDIIWIRGASGTLTADMRNATVYNMIDSGGADQVYSHLYPFPLPMKSLVPMSWDNVFSLTEGTRLFLFGSLEVKNGKYSMKSCREMPLTVIIYNEDPFTLMTRATWCGREGNEFWNTLTPWSVVTGTLLLLISTVWVIQNSDNYALLFLNLFLALLPLILFLPPGVLLLSLYRYFWDRGRRCRAERDLMVLPLGTDALPRDCTASDVAFTRRPGGWKGKEKPVCYPVPQSLVEMSDMKMAGKCIRYPDEPGKLAKFCRRRALYFEALSVLMFCSAVFVNFAVYWWVMIRMV
ncbi:MAG: hypothetical protein PQJ50_14760 [Spirochaetales bacterium]|nr:hypothetical protein [Spirochaetales bacterium]